MPEGRRRSDFERAFLEHVSARSGLHGPAGADLTALVFDLLEHGSQMRRAGSIAAVALKAAEAVAAAMLAAEKLALADRPTPAHADALGAYGEELVSLASDQALAWWRAESLRRDLAG